MQPPNMDIWAFLLGSLSAFAVKFLSSYNYKVKEKNKKNKNGAALFYPTVYILLGGLFTMILEPINAIQAIIFGGAWESIFVRLIESHRNKGVN